MMLVVIMFSPDFCGVEKFLIYTLCCYFTLFSGMLLQDLTIYLWLKDICFPIRFSENASGLVNDRSLWKD